MVNKSADPITETSKQTSNRQTDKYLQIHKQTDLKLRGITWGSVSVLSVELFIEFVNIRGFTA